MLVSHDRRFLDRVVTHVVELDEFTHRIAEYAGGWQAYVDERALDRQHAWERFDDYDTKRKALAGRAQRERRVGEPGLGSGQALDRQRTRQEHPRLPQEPDRTARRQGRPNRAGDRAPGGGGQATRTVAAAPRGGRRRAQRPDRRPPRRDAIVERDGFRLGPIDLLLEYGERVAIVGHNGSGKSTLIDLILGSPRTGVGHGDARRRRFGSARSSRPATSSPTTPCCNGRCRMRPV